jgi:hypothetical protein
MVQYFWDENQKSKFQFFPSGTDLKPILRGFIPEEDLPISYGGTYDYELPKKKSVKEFKAMVDQMPKKNWQKYHVPRSGVFEIEQDIQVARTTICWEFKTKGYDIEFGLKYKDADGTTVDEIPIERFDSHTRIINGAFLVEKTGIYILYWSNYYSYLRGKDLGYLYTINVPIDVGPSIPLNAPAETKPIQKSQSKKKPKKLAQKVFERSDSKKKSDHEEKKSESSLEKSSSEKSLSERSVSEKSLSERSEKSEKSVERSDKSISDSKSEQALRSSKGWKFVSS